MNRVLVPSLLATALLLAAHRVDAQPRRPDVPRGPALRPAAAVAGAARSTGAASLAIHRVDARTAARIDVRSPDLAADAPIPAAHTAYGDNRSPALQWSTVADARSYVLLVEDPDAPTPRPFVHWLAWNIPGNVHALPGHFTARTSAVPGLRQGRNDRGDSGWFGPRPPAGDPPHHYHFQVFALDRMLALPDGATRDALLAAIAGHVLARGELVATSQAPRTH